jgi:hypothetical protein
MAGFATFSSLVGDNFSPDPWKNISKVWEVVSRSRSMLRIGRDLSSAIQPKMVSKTFDPGKFTGNHRIL